MAEIGAAAAALTSAVIKLSGILNNEATFLIGVKDGISRLKGELSWMQSFLKDADNKLDSSYLIRQWVSDVRDLACESEDFIDTFLVKLGSERRIDSCCCCISFATKIFTTHKLGCQIEALMVKAIDISSRRERYGLNPGVSNTHKLDEKLKELRATTSYANKEHMVGLAETVQLLHDKLTNRGFRCFVISILGMGGLGKTTLARKLYNELGREYFSHHAWVCVSQEYDTKDILVQLIKLMINPVKKELDKLTTKDSMEEYLQEHLREDSFLVVIDDVWEREAWESIERALPENNMNSKVIITTRIRRVAEINSAYVHELRYLNEDESWELFCRKAFPYDKEMKCPDVLESVGKEMVAKCSGLPLALVTLGGLLSTKLRGINEWEVVRDNLWKELKKHTVHIDAVLSLSFKELPDYLQQCFLYVGMFPEDVKIPISKLMLLWEAEGFIGQEDEVCPEDTAKSYFNELVRRSLLQRTSEDWMTSTCRVHDLLRDLATRKAKELSFFAFYDENRTFDLLKAPSHRRLATYNLPPSTIPCEYTNHSLRTLLLAISGREIVSSTSTSHLHVDELLRSLHRRFSLLRVLDIAVEDGISNLQIGKLVHLRYLGVKCKSSVELPENISGLKDLQTISIMSRNHIMVPKTLGKLSCLKHLIGNFKFSGDWIGELTSLHTLGYISSVNWGEMDATSLVNLHHLSLKVDVTLQDYTQFYLNFESLTRLRTLALNIRCIDDSQFNLEIFKHRPSITHFKSRGFVNYPDLHLGVNLQVLELEGIRNLEYDPMPSIERLPRLRALRINVSMYTRIGDMIMVCSDGGCPQLRTLDMKFATFVDDFEVKLLVAEGGMPLLTTLHFNRTRNITAPDRIKQLITEAS